MSAFDYQVIRKDRRKTASIQVSPDNRVSVIVPQNLTDEQVDALIKAGRELLRENPIWQGLLAEFE